MVPVLREPGEGQSPLGAEALLAVWETAAPQHPLDRGLTILRAAHPQWSRDDLARLPIGERDALLFGFYTSNFGRRLAAQGFCPQCAGHVEVELDVRDLPLGGDHAGAEQTFEMRLDDLALACRAPDSYDLAAAAGAAAGAVAGSYDIASGRRDLLERCIVWMARQGAPIGMADLEEEQVAAVADAVAGVLEAAEPLADLQLSITCPTCGHVWDLLLDIFDFVWARIERQSRRLLSEVDVLARAYGWREADILALSPARRQVYLEMTGG